MPLGAPSDAPATKAFARALAQLLAERWPEEVVAEAPRAGRVGRVYVDWLQNDATRQTVAPYSLRGTPLPTVATPVTWDEVDAAAAGDEDRLVFLHDAVLERVERAGDLFAPVLELAQELPALP